MTNKNIFSLKDRSFFIQLLVSMVVLTVLLVGIIVVYDYYNTKNIFEKNSRHLKQQTEQDILITIQLTDGSYNLYDSALNEQMRQGFERVLAEYKRAGANPSRMNLTEVKSKLGKEYDIYVINESGIIEFTTYEPERGMDFKTVPYFFEYLTKIRNSDGFFPDHMVGEMLGEGKIRKYAYMPTPDHHYVLELGFSKTSFYNELSSIKYKDAITRITSSNPYIERVRIFNTMGKIADNTTEEVDEPTKIILEQVIQQRQDITIPRPEIRKSVHYLFIDLKSEQYGSDASRIVEITYNDAMQEKAFSDHVRVILLIAILTLAVGIIAAFFLSRNLAKPISEIIKDVNRISGGDLDLKISSTHVAEFQILEQSINTMVESLKGSIKHIKDGEILRREMIDQLPVAVFMKSVKEGKYILWNKASEKIFSLPANEVIGRTDKELFSKEEAAILNREDEEACLNRVFISNKKISDKYRGQRNIHLIIVPIFDSTDNIQYILGVGEDITEESLKMKIDLLFSITRGDVLEQLSIIVNYLERAQLKTSREAMDTFIEKTLESVESIRSKMSFVRSLQDLGAPSPAWQSVKKSFWNAVTLIPITKVKISMETEDIELYADSLLPRVFYNLLANSIKHGDHRLTQIRLYSHISGESLILVYEDDGRGIPVNEKEKIFDFGYGKETGIGLYLIRELLGYTGITITETGEPGKGARFEIVVPKGKFRRVKSE